MGMIGMMNTSIFMDPGFFQPLHFLASAVLRHLTEAKNCQAKLTDGIAELVKGLSLDRWTVGLLVKGLGALGFTKKMGDPKMHGEFFWDPKRSFRTGTKTKGI